MFILRLCIYLFFLATMGAISFWGLKVRYHSNLKENFYLNILTGLCIFVFTQFLLLQFLNFGFDLMLLAFIVSFFVSDFFQFVFKKLNLTSMKVRSQNFDRKNIAFLKYTVLFISILYLSVSLSIFKHPDIWWDEIIHWVPKSKILIQSGAIQMMDILPFKEYPRYWSILLSDFMYIQDKLTHLVPLILYFVYWLFAINLGYRFLVIKNKENFLPLALISVGSILNIGWGAPYADLPLATFYSAALVVLYLILEKRLEIAKIVHASILLGMVTQLRVEGILYSLTAALIFGGCYFFINRKVAIKSFLFMIFVITLFYAPWQIYIRIHSLQNHNLAVAATGVQENLNDFGYMFQKSVKIFLYSLEKIGAISSPYFVVLMSAPLAVTALLKKIEISSIFGTFTILANFLIVFIIILFSPTLTGGYGGLNWWLEADFTRFLNHFLPFVFFINGFLLYKIQRS